jgi:peptide/nickel transport system permease protein
MSQSFMFYPLWTDWMIWGLVLSLGLWKRSMNRSVQFQQQWQQIFESKVATASGVILLAYVLIALIDSIHFQTGGKVMSVLDVMVLHLIEQGERTYSAPFALVEFNKSMQVTANGVLFDYLPLEHIQWVDGFVLASLVKAFALTILLWLLLIGWRSMTEPKLPKVFSTGMVTFSVILLILAWLYFMSFHVHVMGTDKVGQDVFYNNLKSIRTGVLIGVLTTLVMLPLAILLGISAGLFRGWIDDVIQYLYTTLNSIPGVLLIAAGVLVMQTIINNHPDWFSTTEERADLRLLFLVLILGVTSWTGLCRLLRAETLKISQIEFVTAARAFGVSRFQIIRQHILPNVMHIVLIAVVLDFSGLVLAEAVLSYVGVGVDPTMISWGNMINQARLEMAREPMVWWSLFSAFIFMFVLVLAANLFSDRVQRVLNPRNV